MSKNDKTEDTAPSVGSKLLLERSVLLLNVPLENNATLFDLVFKSSAATLKFHFQLIFQCTHPRKQVVNSIGQLWIPQNTTELSWQIRHRREVLPRHKPSMGHPPSGSQRQSPPQLPRGWHQL